MISFLSTQNIFIELFDHIKIISSYLLCQNALLTKCQMTFNIPADTMTKIGLFLNFINKTSDNINNMTAEILVPEMVIASFPQSAVINKLKPAVEIIATTAGRKAFKTFCKISSELYFV